MVTVRPGVQIRTTLLDCVRVIENMGGLDRLVRDRRTSLLTGRQKIPHVKAIRDKTPSSLKAAKVFVECVYEMHEAGDSMAEQIYHADVVSRAYVKLVDQFA